MKRNKRSNRILETLNTPKIEMENKRYIAVNANAKTITDEELKVIIEKLERENLEIKKKCYSQNTPIIIVKQRKFTDLVKKFLNEFYNRTPRQKYGLRKSNI